jgi:hypothetical protein
MTKIQPFLRDFSYDLPNATSSYKTIAKYYLTKALRKFFINTNIYNLKNNQIFGIILRVKYEDNSIKTLSNIRKSHKTSFTLLSTLFKELLTLRAEDFDPKNIKQIVFSYHIFSPDYKDIILNEEQQKEINSQVNLIQVNNHNDINYMNPHKIIKLPLTYAGSSIFLLELLDINNNLSIQNNEDVKYKATVNRLDEQNQCEFKLVLQSDPHIIIYRFIDKLLDIPKLDKNCILIERKFNNEIYFFDSDKSEVVLIKHLDLNKNENSKFNINAYRSKY